MTFPDTGTHADPITDGLTITAANLAEGAMDKTFYLAQGATLDIYGWYNDGADYWTDRSDPLPEDFGVYRSNINNSNNGWEGYRYTSSGLLGGQMDSYFTIHILMLDEYASVENTYTWTFYVLGSGEGSASSITTSSRGRDINIMTDEQIFMSDIDNFSQFLIYQSDADYNCVESYTIYGGSEQPFEYIKLKINKKQLSVLAPELIDYIIPGRNIITLFGPGQGEYIVTKCTKSSDTWTVTAYALMEQIRGLIISTSRPFSELKPIDMIINLVRSTSDEYASSWTNPLNLVHNIHYLVKKDNNSWEDATNKSFGAGLNVWYAIQVCALKLNAKIWLADGTLYIIDTSITEDEARDDSKTDSTFSRSTSPFDDVGTIYLNSEGGFPLCPTEYQQNIMNNVTGTPELGEDGCNVLRNTVTVSYGTNGATAISSTEGNPGRSRDIFNVKMHSIDIPQISSADAQAIADTMANRYCDAETSISFSMVEAVTTEVTTTIGGVTTTKTVRSWQPFFTPLTRIKRIVDYANETTISITSNLDLISEFYNKGMLSLYEIQFPQHITKYTFGISTPTDISQNNSEILNAINNG